MTNFAILKPLSILLYFLSYVNSSSSLSWIGVPTTISIAKPLYSNAIYEGIITTSAADTHTDISIHTVCDFALKPMFFAIEIWLATIPNAIKKINNAIAMFSRLNVLNSCLLNIWRSLKIPYSQYSIWRARAIASPICDQSPNFSRFISYIEFTSKAIGMKIRNAVVIMPTTSTNCLTNLEITLSKYLYVPMENITLKTEA